MGVGRVFALSVLLWTGVANGETWLRSEPLRQGLLGLPGVTVEARTWLFDASTRTDHARVSRGRSLVFGYTLEGARASVQLRAGYRFGLPLEEAVLPASDEGWVLTSGGSFAISAGSVGRLQLDLDGFREVAGARLVRIDAVPGLRVHLNESRSLEAGVGCLAALQRTSSEGFGIERFAAIVQFGGGF